MNTPETAEQPIQAQPEQPAGLMNFLRNNRLAKYAAIGAGALTLGGGTALLASSGGNNNVASAAAENFPVLVGSESQAIANCNSMEFSQAASDAAHYNPEAFVPNTPVTTSEEAKQYVFNLFSKDGAISDPGTEAALMSTVVLAAHHGGFENTNYDYLSHFNATLGRYHGSGGLERARRDCKEAVNTMVQDVGYNSNWAQPGETVTEFAATRDKNNVISGAELNTGTTKVTLQGIEFIMRDTSKGENGYLSVLISTDSEGVANGNIYIKGLSKVQVFGKNPNHKGKLPAGMVVHRTSSGKLTIGKAGGGGTFGNTSGSGEGNHAGNVPESGNQQGATTGTTPSFGRGGGTSTGQTVTRTSTVPGTTSTETVPQTTTTETTPTTTTVTTPTTTTVTTSSTPTKGSCEPNCNSH